MQFSIIWRRASSRLKYPSLVSYNKLPWVTLAPDAPALHRHLTPLYEHILKLASATFIPRLVQESHPAVTAEQRLRVLPGMLYLLPVPAEAAPSSSVLATAAVPEGFSDHLITDSVSLQYYGPVERHIGAVAGVDLLTSEDLRLVGLHVCFRTPLRIPIQQGSSLSLAVERGTATASSTLSLYHFFRPHQSPATLTRPLERFLATHRPNTEEILCSLGLAATSSSSSSSRSNGTASWTPCLQPPKRLGHSKKKMAAMPEYRPPQSYLMGLAERLAVRPGDCFGRRSLMWGHWF